jgi:hypothetical protein
MSLQKQTEAATAKIDASIAAATQKGGGVFSLEERTTDAAMIARLAALPHIEYDRQREAAAEKLGCRVGTLDAQVGVARSVNEPRDESGTPLPVQNSFGAVYEAIVAEWQVGQVSVIFHSTRGGRLDFGEVYVDLPAAVELTHL